MPPAPASAEEDDPTQGEWLFKSGELVLGPVTAMVLVEKITKGELSADTPIARDGQAFKPMKVRKLFRDAIAARDEERRLAAEERAFRAAVVRSRVLRVLVMIGLFAGPAAASALGARQLMSKRPWDDTDAWIAKVPPLVDLPQRPPEVKKDPLATGAAVASAGSTATPSPDAQDPTTAKTGVRNGNAGPTNVGGNGLKKPNGDAEKPGDATPGDAKPADDKPTDKAPDKPVEKPSGALPETLTNAQAIEPLKAAQGDLKACFKAEMDTNPEIPAQVVLSYTVTEDGRAINVALDARELRGRPVVPCVQKAIGGLRWPRFSGERKNVSVPFKLGKPGGKK